MTPDATTADRDPKGATEATRARLDEVAASLPPVAIAADHPARRGLLARLEAPIAAPDGTVVWDPARWSFADGDAPGTVNPSLWRQATLNASHGLFEVIDGVYQVRGYDISNVTFVRGETGWIVIDPLTTTATARAAFELVQSTLGPRPVTAMIYTHSHPDHYGGVLGVLDPDDAAARQVPVIAPAGFLAAVVAENVIAGPAMMRRATYMYGLLLPAGERGHVDCGLGKSLAFHASGLIAPTVEIERTGQELVVDGVRIVFQMAPDSEAPAEMHFHFPDLRMLCMAENCSGTMHNVLTPRGAVVRDSLSWSRYVDEAIDTFGAGTDVVITSHNWPEWGQEACLAYLRNQRDLYRWIHDQSMRLANLGATPLEIAAELSLPAGLWADWRCHGYYGTVSHNSRAVYQRYLGFYDGNPARLDPHPPAEAGRRYVEAMGGADAVVARAREAFAEGDYRWAAQLLDHLVFADPGHEAGRLLQADTLEQLGYQAESGPWRDFYLSGAAELRQGPPPLDLPNRPNPLLVAAMSLEQVFDALAVRLDGPRATELGRLVVEWRLPDLDRQVGVELSNGTLHARPDRTPTRADVVVTGTREVLDEMLARGRTPAELVAEGRLAVEGDAERLEALWALLVDFPVFFPIATP